MKALTLHQPWAHLVAIGAKQFETRSWPTKHRGLLAIHAGRDMDASLSVLRDPDPVLANESARPTYRVPFNRYLKRDWSWLFGELCHGSIVALVNVRNCWPADHAAAFLKNWAARFPEDRKRVQEELAFGDYSPGRWAWQLELICDLSLHGRLVRGYQGLWNVPADVELHLFAACAGIGIYLAPNSHLQLKAA